MFQILKDRETLIIVIHEIYGMNQHVESYCKSLSEQGYDVICPNLLKSAQPFDYAEEEKAYQNFMENIGFEAAIDKLKKIVSSVKNEYQKIFLIGFSIGATIAWLCSEEECLDGIVGYYGSRIRNYKDKVPLTPVLLFFPEKEPSFNVDELITFLQQRSIEIHTFNGRHGFGDRYSPNYNDKSAKRAFSEMLSFITKSE